MAHPAVVRSKRIDAHEPDSEPTPSGAGACAQDINDGTLDQHQGNLDINDGTTPPLAQTRALSLSSMARECENHFSEAVRYFEKALSSAEESAGVPILLIMSSLCMPEIR